ncbi:hypothetical protein NEUTE2DRAFT_45591, partial [Neurospora tetrasperma FGSC 2509]
VTKLELMLRALERRNIAGKNKNYNVRCQPADRSTFLRFLGMGRFGVGARRL